MMSHTLREATAANPASGISEMSEASNEQQQPRILVIEDEPDIADVIRFNLQKEDMVVETALDGEQGLSMARTRIYDLILLDLMLPGLSGADVCRLLREDPRTKTIPVVMVTSLSSEDDVVSGLEVGADDYVTKPFSLRELIARVRSALRRQVRETSGVREKPLRRGILECDPVRHEIRVDGEVVALTLSEFRLLHHLMRHPGRVFSRSDLIPHVVGSGVVVLDRNIDVHVRNLRRKLGERAARHVATVRGLGYKFEERAG
jgi:DNA-binding response OmpR family regulator